MNFLNIYLLLVMWNIKLRWCLDRQHFLIHPTSLIIKNSQKLKVQVKDLMECGYIMLIKSPCSMFILFMDKKGKKLRMCIDNHALNKITIKNNYPLPQIHDLYNCLNGACYFSCINLKSGY